MKKGFTLLELLIVIGILAILATAVTLVLNPIEILKQSRDGKRLSDLKTLNNAITYFITASTTPTPNTFNCTASTTPYSGDGGTCNNALLTNITGTGWVNVNFSSMAGGSPLSRLPLDPINGLSGSAYYFYIYKTESDGSQFEFNANMESVKYSTNGGSDVESNTKDGGDNNGVYEIGSFLTSI